MVQAYQDGTVSDMAIQRIGVTSSAYLTDVTLTVTGPTDSEVVVRKADGTYATVGKNANGTFVFTLERGTTATVLVSADGFENNSLAISETNTAGATYSASITLTEA